MLIVSILSSRTAVKDLKHQTCYSTKDSRSFTAVQDDNENNKLFFSVTSVPSVVKSLLRF